MSYDPDATVGLTLHDALNRECVQLDEAEDLDPFRFLATDGIDATTGTDTVCQPHHAGAMLSVGFAMMETDDDC